MHFVDRKNNKESLPRLRLGLTTGSPSKKACSSSFYYLYNIRRIRKYLPKHFTETLIYAFITSRIDYCNSFLYGLPDFQIHKLQRVRNACARLFCKFCHITPLLMNLHWLPVRYRIDFKILLITFVENTASYIYIITPKIKPYLFSNNIYFSSSLDSSHTTTTNST